MAKTKNDLHTISILVANKPGVLLRVALIFARRGFNIDSLVVSPAQNEKYSRMTITAQGDLQTLDQIIKQSQKLVDVIHAEEHDPTHSVELELALVKTKASKAIQDFVAKASKKYRASVIDSSEDHMIIKQTGTTEQLDEFETELRKRYGIIEMVRSGKLLMAKGKEHT